MSYCIIFNTHITQHCEIFLRFYNNLDITYRCEEMNSIDKIDKQEIVKK